MAYQLYAACGSNVGRLRGSNEDNYCFDGTCKEAEQPGTESTLRLARTLDRAACFAVFDGMGGEAFGEAAAFAGADTLCGLLRKEEGVPFGDEALRGVTEYLNLAVLEKKRELQADRMGSTLVMLCLSGTRAWVCNLGDSRAYLLREGELRQLSRDHVRRTGMPGQKKPPLNQHLGIDPKELRLVPEIREEQLHLEDLFLLCSDGITDMLTDMEIRKILMACQSAASCAEELITTALDKGGRDNITAVLCRIL